MTMEFNHTDYGSAKGILVFPDHYVAFGVKHAKGTAGTPGLSTLIDGRYIVKAGTIYPANDATAQGVVLNDVDVTNGDGNLAVVIHGFVALAKLPVVPAAAAISALKGISFLPIVPFQTITLTGTKQAIAVGATTGTTWAVVVAINNATFRDEAATKTNWTITNESTTKISVDSIVVAADKKSVVVTLKATAAAVAGDVTIRPAASVISINTQPAAFTVATVA